MQELLIAAVNFIYNKSISPGWKVKGINPARPKKVNNTQKLIKGSNTAIILDKTSVMAHLVNAEFLFVLIMKIIPGLFILLW